MSMSCILFASSLDYSTTHLNASSFSLRAAAASSSELILAGGQQRAERQLELGSTNGNA